MLHPAPATPPPTPNQANDPSRASESALLFLFFGVEHLIPVTVYLFVAFGIRRGKDGFVATTWKQFKKEVHKAKEASGVLTKVFKVGIVAYITKLLPPSR